MRLLIKAGRVVDPANNLDAVSDILVEDGKITKVAKNIPSGAGQVIDAAGKIVLPGIVDMHVHLREPGREDKETIATGTAAAIKGGVTSVLAMPNTAPAIDAAETVQLLKGIVAKSGQANVYVCAAITKGRLGQELTQMRRLKEAGAIAFSDDGASVDNPDLLSEALRQAAQDKVLLIAHCEDKTLSAKGQVNAGLTSTRLGLRGIPRESEYKRVERDISLAEKTGARLHIAHVSCRESVDLIAAAKKRGGRVSAETAPHYFALTEDAVLGYDPNTKINPPLRGEEDVEAIKKGLKNGAIDAIASDHAPHTENEKDIEFERAEFGVVGLETELAAAITELIEAGVLDWQELVRKMCLNPARILGIPKGRLGVGDDADIVLVNPHKEWTVSKENLISKSKNCAFLGRKLKGMVEYTIRSGKVVYKAEDGIRR